MILTIQPPQYYLGTFLHFLCNLKKTIICCWTTRENLTPRSSFLLPWQIQNFQDLRTHPKSGKVEPLSAEGKIKEVPSVSLLENFLTTDLCLWDHLGVFSNPANVCFSSSFHKLNVRITPSLGDFRKCMPHSKRVLKIRWTSASFCHSVLHMVFGELPSPNAMTINPNDHQKSHNLKGIFLKFEKLISKFQWGHNNQKYFDLGVTFKIWNVPLVNKSLAELSEWNYKTFTF